jgi:hypothetical protein
MKEEPRLARAVFLASLAILGSAWGPPRASAEIIDVFTGSWQLQSYIWTAWGQNQRIPSIEGPIDSTRTARFGFDGVVTDYSNQEEYPTPWGGFQETWSGLLSGGTVSFVAYSWAMGGEYSFAGTITGGSFAGQLVCEEYIGDCLWENVATFSFISSGVSAPGSPDVPTRGWLSEGTFSVMSTSGYSTGTLSMTTTAVPEPGSMMLLGAGIAVFAVRGRTRRALS